MSATKAFCSRLGDAWIVHECPFCHETHSHGGGGLSHREPHCVRIDTSGSYELTPVASEHDARLMQSEQQGFLVRRLRSSDDALHAAWNRRGRVTVTKKTRNAIARWDFVELTPERYPSPQAVDDFVTRVAGLGVDPRKIVASPCITSVEAPWLLALQVAAAMSRFVEQERTGR